MGSDSTTQLQALLDRINAGDAQAREELIARACERLRRLTRKVFRSDFRRVGRFEDTGDVLQNCLLRLHRRLQAIAVQSVADYFKLAAREIRLELITLARHYYGPAGDGTRLVPAGAGTDSSSHQPADAEADSSSDPVRLTLWTEFHEKVEAHGALQRATVDLLWYHGMTQEEAAAMLNMSLSSFKRHWMAARLRLREFLEDHES